MLASACQVVTFEKFIHYMELSILIPVYRYDCTQLVADLEAQGDALDIDYELITADDEELRLGRAGIRNYLADEAQGKYLLFIDCDAAVENPHFIENYLKIANMAEVVCGGLYHADELPSPSVSLRYRYEKEADKHRSARERSRHPYDKFTTFNFLIKREVFQRIRFNEACVGYGHEDTFFGAKLKECGISILHIDNPLRHDGLESNDYFLEKTREALRNLSRMADELKGHSPLLKTYSRLEYLGFNQALGDWFTANREWFERKLRKRHPSLFLFKLYKLGYYCKL